MTNDFVFVSTIQTSLIFKRNQTFLIFNPPYTQDKVNTLQRNPYTIHMRTNVMHKVLVYMVSRNVKKMIRNGIL